MKILHTEASPNWGGQEIRVLREAEGMRARGHEVIFALEEGGMLVKAARESGFLVFEMTFRKRKALSVFFQLLKLIRKYGIEIVNTHSSVDAWIGGFAGKVGGALVIRTRHLSTPVRKGINSKFLYNWLADYVVTTCEEAKVAISRQAALPSHRCISIPTGVDPSGISYDATSAARFRQEWGIQPDECLVGMLCYLRTWKGVGTVLHAAKLLEKTPKLKWMIVGSGISEQHFLQEWKRLGLEGKVIFTGHLSPPFTALGAMDIFVLPSWANEGVSQASLQAAWLEKPLITTTVGGLPEVCIDNVTGLQVSPRNPKAVADAVLTLAHNKELRLQLEKRPKNLCNKNLP